MHSQTELETGKTAQKREVEIIDNPSKNNRSTSFFPFLSEQGE